MKIYFEASVTGKKLYLNNYIKIVETLKEMGHEVRYNDFFNVTVEKIRKESRAETIIVHENLARLKMWCDIMVVEASYRSTALGQEIAHAFRIGKPVLAMHVDGAKPHLILSEAGDRLLVCQYNLNDLKRILKEGINYLNPHETRRFTMNIPAIIVDYLDEVSKESKVSRSDYIRNLIIQDMEKHKNSK